MVVTVDVVWVTMLWVSMLMCGGGVSWYVVWVIMIASGDVVPLCGWGDHECGCVG